MNIRSRILLCLTALAATCGSTLALAQTKDTTIAHGPSAVVVVHGAAVPDLAAIEPRDVQTKSIARAYEQTAATVIGDALRSVSSSLDIRRYGTLGSIALPSFRGLPVEYTILYRDGVRLTNEQSGYTDLGQLTLHGLGRFELIPASSAVMLGGDAIGAALNLVTATPDSLSVSAGSEQTAYAHTSGLVDRSYFASVSARPTRDVAVSVGGSLDASPGNYAFFDDSAARYVQRENNDADMKSAYLSGMWSASLHDVVRLSANYFNIDRGLPGPNTTIGRGASNLTERQGDVQWLTSLRYERVEDNWTASATMSLQDQRETYTDRAYQIRDTSDNALWGAQLRVSDVLTDQVTAYAGFEWLHTLLTGTTHSSSGVTDFNRDRMGAYAAAKYQPWSSVSLAASLRAESVTPIAGPQWLPQVTLSYSPIADVELSGAYSRSFHAPTLNDLYWRGAGNPDLQPEHGVNWQAAAGYRLQGASVTGTLRATYFHAQIENEIVWVPEASDYRPVNVSEVRTSGLELNGTGTLAIDETTTVLVDESYTILSARNRTSDAALFGKELQYTSPTSSLLTLQIEKQQFGSIALLARYRGHRYTDPANLESGKLAPLTLFDLTVSTSSFGFGAISCRALVSVANLADAQYVEALHYPMPGRTYRFSIEVRY